MKIFRLFATMLLVALCATFVSSCSDDDDDKDKELTSLIIGKWKFVNSDGEIDDDGTEFKSNGRWEEINDDYSGELDSGKFWIKSEVLYMESKIEEETWIYHIKKIDSKELILDDSEVSTINLVRIH